MYARIITVTGWTWEYIDNLVTLPMMMALINYWGEHPPLHEMKAAELGIKSSKTVRTQGKAEAQQLVAELMGSGQRGQRMKL